jgi:protein involved in polysaccharide export with SLBB domain
MCALLSLASCGVHGKRLSVDTYRAPSDPSVLAVGQPINVSNTELNYAIGLRDVISVEVDEHSEFGGNFKVEEDGTFELPTVYRRIYVSGLSTRQAEARICDIIGEMVVGSPTVRVKVLLSRSRDYYILGAVKQEGKYFMGLQDVTVRDALIEANLWGDGAKTGTVYVITPDVNNHPTYITVDGGAILKGSLRDNVVLRPGDIVYVPTTLYSDITKVLEEIIGQANRVQQIEGDLKYGGQLGTEGFGKYTPGTPVP